MQRRPGTASHRRLEDEFYKIMNKFTNKQWNEFARNKRSGLNLPEYQIDDIKADYIHDIREQKYQMLSLWQRRNGRRATVEYLENLVENFLHPPPPPEEVQPRVIPEPPAQDVGNRHPSNDDQLLVNPTRQTTEPIVQHSAQNNPVDEESLRSIPVHGEQSINRTFSSGQNDSNSARTEPNPQQQPAETPLSSVEVHSASSLPDHASNSLDRRPTETTSTGFNVHGPSSLPNHAYNSLDLPSRSTASTSMRRDVGDSSVEQASTTPKSITTPSATIHEGRNRKNKAVPIPKTFPHIPIFGGGVQINVTGKNAIGVQTNYYYGGKKVDKRRTTHVTSDTLAEYCSGVGNINITPSDRDFYDEHLERQDTIYRITHRPKGAVLILNNSFPGDEDRRFGSDKDVRNMEILWRKLDSKVYLKTEITAAESIETFTKFASHRTAYESDFVVIIIMSHGGQEKGEDVFYGANREPVKVKEVLEIFSNKNARRLQGIPKLFFFQFCRGTDVDMGTESMATVEPSETLFNSLDATVRESSGVGYAGDSTDSQGIQTTKQPTMSDTMISFATQAGYRAFRNNEEGSWYVNAIVNIFMRHAHDQHMVELMTVVNNAVASKTANNDQDRTVHEGKEMSDFKSTLRKKLFLFPGFPDDSNDEEFI